MQCMLVQLGVSQPGWPELQATDSMLCSEVWQAGSDFDVNDQCDRNRSVFSMFTIPPTVPCHDHWQILF